MTLWFVRAPYYRAIVLCLSAAAAHGQNCPDEAENIPALSVTSVNRSRSAFTRTAEGVRSAFTTLVRDEALLWISPARSPRATLNTVFSLIAVTGAALSADRRLASGLPNSADQVRYSKAVSVAGTYYALGAASGAFTGIGALTGNRRAVETGLLAAQAVAHTESIAQMLKYAAGRERPDFGDAGGRFWRRQQSFPSGHAMGTWAVAAVISREYHDKRLIRYGIYALPVLVSASRIGAQRHFLSDVVAGGSIGHLMGSWLYRRHHDSTLGGATVGENHRKISLQPAIRYDQKWGGVSFALHISR